MYPKDKYEWIVILTALGCILFGVLFSLIKSDWQWLERSGSLVVIVALCFFWRDRIDSDEAFIQEMIDIEKECKETLKTITPKTDLSNKNLVVFYNVDEVKAKERIEILRIRYTNIEAGSAVLGTFIWGYGSPLACAIWGFSSCA